MKLAEVNQKADEVWKLLVEGVKAALMLAVGGVFFVIGWSLLHRDTKKTELPTQAQLSSAQFLDDKYGISAALRCPDGADDYLRSVAKYDFEWDQMGTLDAKFDRFRNAVEQPGILTMVSGKAKLSNGFGAYQHITLYCDFDTQNGKVSGYRFTQ